MDVNDPLVIDGWSSLRVFYKLEHIHQILFRYVGNSTFQITVFSSMSAISIATKFLTNILWMWTKHPFRMKLTKSQRKWAIWWTIWFYIVFYMLFCWYKLWFIFLFLFCFFLQDLPLTLQLTFGNVDSRG